MNDMQAVAQSEACETEGPFKGRHVGFDPTQLERPAPDGWAWYMLLVDPRRPSVSSPPLVERADRRKHRRPEPLRLGDGGLAAPDGVPMRAEFVVEELLVRRKIEAWVPRQSFYIRANRYHRKAKRLVHQPILPGAVLAHLSPVTGWHELLSLPLVRGVVGYGSAPMRVPAQAIARLREISLDLRAPDWQRPMPTHRTFKAGDEVEVLEGGYAGQRVKVVELRGELARVVCRIFGSDHEVKISVEKLGGLV